MMELREKDTRKVVAGLKCCAGNAAMCGECYLGNSKKCTTILKQDAIEHIEEIEKELEYFSEKYNETCIELTKERENKWISVEDRLPEPMESVLIYDHKNKRIAICRFGNRSTDAGSFCSHWMPLPEPPKPKEPTFKDVFLKAFPKTEIIDDRPAFCIRNVFPYVDECDMGYVFRCKDCWNQPYFEEEEEGESGE